ncbi:MAG: hypothetical protein LC721_11645 [Actinobacteria bacterium]|nr:hypothetical protein [Actinomycetota bacterium]
MTRLVETWDSRAMVALRRLSALLLRALGWLLRALVWQLRVMLTRISPRARIVLLVLVLVMISAWTSSSMASVSETAQGLAVLIVAFIGLWWIATAPFKTRRWW